MNKRLFRQFLRHIHPVGAHTQRNQRVLVPFLRRRNNAYVYMNVGRIQLVKYILELAEILLDVPLDGLHLLLSVDLRRGGFLFILGLLIFRCFFPTAVRPILAGLPGDLQRHLLRRQRDAGAAGDGVLIVRRKADSRCV